jgi:class 3 adenylate cyclase
MWVARRSTEFFWVPSVGPVMRACRGACENCRQPAGRGVSWFRMGMGVSWVAELPRGTVTFLFTDLEGSSRLWEQHPDAMEEALARHDSILREAVESHDGHVVKTTGDGAHAVFATARDAVGAAVVGQQGLADERWGSTGRLRVRMGIHTGEAQYREGDYYGPALNRAARLAGVAHGGQVVCSQATADLARDGLPDGLGLADLGEHRLRDLSRPERVFEVQAPGLEREFGPLASLDAFPGNLPLQVSSCFPEDLPGVLVTERSWRANGRRRLGGWSAVQH